MGTKKMPPPMTLETTMAAASRGPRRRSSDAPDGEVTRGACESFFDNRTWNCVLADFLPLRIRVLRKQLNLRVDELGVGEHLLTRLGPGVAKLRLHRLTRCRGTGRESFSAGDLHERAAPLLVFRDAAEHDVGLEDVELLIGN